MKPVSVHEAVQPLSWLIGKWKSIRAKGQYPTMKPFYFNEEIEFRSLGQPLLNYFTKSWNCTDKSPMHMEAGFLQIKPGTAEVAFIIAHNRGVTTVEEGFVNGTCMTFKHKNIGLMKFVKYPPVVETTRTYKYCCNSDRLEMILCIATCNTPLTEHLRICYKKDKKCGEKPDICC